MTEPRVTGAGRPSQLGGGSIPADTWKSNRLQLVILLCKTSLGRYHEHNVEL